MKKTVNILALLTLALLLCFSLASCAKDNAQDESTTSGLQSSEAQKSETVYYDRNGEPYDTEEAVKYYDKNGNVYHYTMVEDYLPDYVDEKTGEHINGFECYIDEDGYFCHIADKSVKLVKNSVDTYEDSDGKKYYDISTVSWDSDGNMIHNNFVIG